MFADTIAQINHICLRVSDDWVVSEDRYCCLTFLLSSSQRNTVKISLSRRYSLIKGQRPPSGPQTRNPIFMTWIHFVSTVIFGELFLSMGLKKNRLHRSYRRP